VSTVTSLGVGGDSLSGASLHEWTQLKECVQLVSFKPFQRAEDSLQNINDVSEGVLSDSLKDFIELNVPREKGVELGVGDDKLGTAIHEQMHLSCRRGEEIRELLRAIRANFTKFVKPLRDGVLEKAQLGLGHAYSRAKVKFNVNRADNMIIQSVALVDQIDKDLNTLSMRLREWYSYIFPELARLVSDHYTYARLVLLLGNREALSGTADDAQLRADIIAELARAQALVADASATPGVVAADPETTGARILAAARRSIGADVGELDLISVRRLADKVTSLSEYRKRLFDYLAARMDSVAPSLSALVGETLGARLISHAGSLTNLAKCPASTVQILGAEKALFRALKTRGNTPKYGLLFHSTFIGRAGLRNKGRIARYLANKCTIASRLDSFSDAPSSVFGVALREQVEERLRFYDTGVTPRKNVDVMAVALASKTSADAAATPGKRKRADEPAAVDADADADDKVAIDNDDDDDESSASSSDRKKKKKKEKKEKKAKKEKKEGKKEKKKEKK
jgi:nucleolar protein 56